MSKAKRNLCLLNTDKNHLNPIEIPQGHAHEIMGNSELCGSEIQNDSIVVTVLVFQGKFSTSLEFHDLITHKSTYLLTNFHR